MPPTGSSVNCATPAQVQAVANQVTALAAQVSALQTLLNALQNSVAAVATASQVQTLGDRGRIAVDDLAASVNSLEAYVKLKLP